MRALTRLVTVPLVTAAILGPTAVTLALLPSPAVAVVADCNGVQEATTPSDDDKAASAPMTSMAIRQFQDAVKEQSGKVAGTGVGVAVVDSGVVAPPGGGLQVVEHVPIGTVQPTSSYHGTAVAGLIGGAPVVPGRPVGVAPGARLVDAHFYDQDNSGESTGSEGAVLTADTLTAALNAVSVRVPADGIRIVNVSVGVESTPSLEAAVTRLTAQGVLVVASSGNRPTDQGFPSGYATPQKGENAADAVFPAGYALDNPRVVAVGSTVEGDDPLSAVLANAAIDVVTPTQNAVSYAVNSRTCSLGADAATSWSAAYVSGTLAALMTAFPKDTADETVARLEATATGQSVAADVPSDRLVGRGVIQPIEALSRPLAFTRKGEVKQSTEPTSRAEPVPLPQPPPDVLQSTRHRALWWGLSGFGALLVAVTLRPVLARRRR